MFPLRCTVKNILSISSKQCAQLPLQSSLKQLIPISSIHTTPCSFEWNAFHLCLPKPLHNRLWRKVQYPEKYTVEPLPVTNLAGRDPDTGRVVTARLGGGIKHKYHWIDWHRRGPNVEGEFFSEKVLEIMDDGCRTAKVALVGSGDKLRYILATVNMKPGDIIRTSQYIPRAPVLPNEGDAFPLGALPVGTVVNCIEKIPGSGGFFVHAAGGQATILRKVNERVVVKMPSKLEISFDQRCMATVGQISNIEHASIPIGSPNKHRQMGRRPKSGLWQRKTGRFGRKIKPPPPTLVMKPLEKPDCVYRRLTLDHIKIKLPRNQGLIGLPTENSWKDVSADERDHF